MSFRKFWLVFQPDHMSVMWCKRGNPLLIDVPGRAEEIDRMIEFVVYVSHTKQTDVVHDARIAGLLAVYILK